MSEQSLAEFYDLFINRSNLFGNLTDEQRVEKAIDGVFGVMNFIARRELEGLVPKWWVGETREDGVKLLVLDYGNKLGPTDQEKEILDRGFDFKPGSDLPEQIKTGDFCRVKVYVQAPFFRLATRLGPEEHQTAAFEELAIDRVARTPEIIIPWVSDSIKRPFRVFQEALRGRDYGVSCEHTEGQGLLKEVQDYLRSLRQ